MAYTSLYRKFRPLNFSEMVGQEHITKTLKNQIISGRVGHAYLFNGSRGTGKTTAAKIMARAVNCLNPKNGEPCNECEICKAMLSGSLTDVVEMDAASNNSVDDIRAIRDEVNFLPTLAKYRVYIIDEVHMLSTGAFNALLKTLEEPPEHVKFILATTEPQKLPATILSRCQRFDFKRISIEDIIKRLEIICKESNINITEEALRMIAVLSEGALRDAISILERCTQDETDKINEDQIRELVGIPKLTYIRQLTSAILSNETEIAIEEINNVINEGKDLDNFLWEVIKYIKDILIYKSTKSLELYSKDEIKHIEELGNKTSKEQLLKLIYDLSELSNQMKWSTQKNIIFETGIIKASMSSELKNEGSEHSNSQATNKEKLPENKKEDKEIKANKANNVNQLIADTNNVKKEIKMEIKREDENEIKETKETKAKDSNNLNNSNSSIPYWGKVLDEIKKNGKVMIYTNLIGTKAISLDDMTIGIEFPNKLSEFAKKVLNEYENRTIIEKLVSMEAGNTMRVKYLNGNNSGEIKPKDKIENIVNNLDIPINIIDE